VFHHLGLIQGSKCNIPKVGGSGNFTAFSGFWFLTSYFWFPTMTIRQHTLDTPYMVGPVHSYTVEAAGELILIDTGPPTRSTEEYLRQNLDFSRLRHVLITHCHIDHYGLAYWLERETEATIYVPYRDALKIRGHETRLEGMYQALRELGFGEGYLEQLSRTLNSGLLFPPFPEKFRIIEEDLPESLGISYLSCPGHSQSDLVFLGEDWAVTGDVLLRGIFQSPLFDVDLETGERFRNYNAYCETLVKLGTIRGRRIMPGHRERVDSVEETILFYIGKMLERVEQLIPCADEENVARIIDRLFGKNLIEPFHIFIKASEIVFMKDFLEEPDRLRDALTTIGLFAAVSDLFQAVTSR
jgi:hydroxyacylglutathione hydrolase